MTAYAYPFFGQRPVGEVRVEDISAALLPIWKTKAETASRVLQRIRTVINYAAAMGYADGLDSERWEQLKHSLPKNEREREVEDHAACPHAQAGALLQQVQSGPSSPEPCLRVCSTAARAAQAPCC